MRTLQRRLFTKRVAAGRIKPTREKMQKNFIIEQTEVQQMRLLAQDSGNVCSHEQDIFIRVLGGKWIFYDDFL